LKIEGFLNPRLLYESSNTVIYRAVEEKSKRKVILKSHKSVSISGQDSSRLDSEYRLLRKCAGQGVIGVFGQAIIDASPVIVMEDIGGESIADILTSARLNLQEFLSLGIQITGILAAIHAREIIHKDINPANIIWNREKNIVRIIDFGISTELTREVTSGGNPNIIEGTLQYISPEQTGRMNRILDYRSDFYSLGITFYQMLTGHLPFHSDELLTLIHNHIALQPKSPAEISTDIPEAVSRIVMKLMAKNAEDRYNSAHGILMDLERCKNELESSGSISSFEPGQDDVSDQFRIPQKLYGRSEQVKTLIAAFNRIRNSCAELLLVSGASGTGKSLLVNEIQRPVVKHNALYISGKFERLNTDIPYSAIIQAVSNLARQILAEEEELLTAWKDSLLSVLGANAKIITDMFPLFKHILGKQPDLPRLGPVESQNRFNIVLKNFFRGIVHDERPLVLFLDDLQWADSASLQLIQLLVSDQECRSLLIIGSYRSDEKDESAQLASMLREIAENGTSVTKIDLEPFEQSSVMNLLADTLHCEIDSTTDLSGVILEKTGGNPFYISEFLKKLYTDKHIQFSFTDGWTWNIAGIQKMQVTDNVVDLMVHEYQFLSDEYKAILKLISCIGSGFKSDLIVELGEFNGDQSVAILDGLVHEGLLNRYNGQYHFSHDRIQESAYSLLSDEEKSNIHYRIGRHELRMVGRQDSNENVFNAVNQLNAGRAQAETLDERIELAGLNRTAAIRSLRSNAYKSAYNYCVTGIELLDESSWKRQYDLALSLYTEATVAAQLNADYDSMKKYADTVLQKATTVLDTVRVYEAEIFACAAQNRLLEGVRAGLTALKKFGIKLPEKPSKIRIILELLSVKTQLITKPVEKLVDLDQLSNPRILAAMRILAGFSSSVYVASPNLLPLLIIVMVKLSIRYGNSLYSPYFYAAFGMLHCGVLGDVETGYKLGRLALDLQEKYSDIETKSRVGFLFWFFIHHWKRPVQEAFQPMIEAHKIGLETGDLEFSAWNLNSCIELSIFAGVELTGLENDKARSIEFARELNQDHIVSVASIDHQALLDLTGKSQGDDFLAGTSFDKKQVMPKYIKENNSTGLFIAYAYLLQLHYLFGEYHKALEYANLVKPISETQIAHMILPSINMFDSLTRLALFEEQTGKERKGTIKTVSRNQKQLQRWADSAPSNYYHKYLLVAAELNRVTGNQMRAIDLYGKAQQAAEENGLPGNVALCLERISCFWSERCEKQIAAVYLELAMNAYKKWGAHARVQDLVTRHSELVSMCKSSRGDGFRTSTTSYSGMSDTIDLLTVIKTSQKLASEIDLGRLLEAILRFAIENAGAQRGFLIFKHEENDGLCIEAEIGAEESISVLESKPIESAGGLSVSIVQYVDRTGETVILRDAGNEGYFTDDPYVINNGVKSLICTPVSHKDKKNGIIYLENNLVTDSFSEERIELLNVVTSQAAISIENARLYRSLEQKVEERTFQLQEANRQLTELSLKDHLTQLRNRRYVHEFISDFSAGFIGTQKRLLDTSEKRDLHLKGKVLGIFLLDIDYFKKVNDTWGHKAGDSVLVAVSNLLKKNIREDDVLVRWGGEEFLVILSGTNPEYLSLFSKKILNAMASEPHEVTPGTTIFKTCSIGCAKLPAVASRPDMLDLDQIINICDYALYMAKERGRNRAIQLDIINDDNLDDEKHKYLSTLSKNSPLDESCISLEEIVP
jgi:diguanylate cyclase (GGDEF)-like protein